MTNRNSVAVQRSDQPQAVALTNAEVKAELEAIRPQLEEALPRTFPGGVDRFVRVVAGAIMRNPDIMRCDKLSVFEAVLQAGQLGLEPTGLLGSAYLVPYGRKCALIPGYRGLIDLARRSGEIESIYAQIVYGKDYFRIRQGTDPGIDHDPYIAPPGADPESSDEELKAAADPGPVIGAYMVAVLRDRSGQASIRQIEWMTRAEIEAIRKRSKAGSNGPWISDWNEMARKTVVRRGAKYLPLTPEAVTGFSLDEMAERDAEPDRPRGQSGRARIISTLAERKGVQEEGGSEADPEEGQVREEDSATDSALCGSVPPVFEGQELAMPCSLPRDHEGKHESDEGVWPR